MHILRTIIAAALLWPATANPLELRSPNGDLVLNFEIGNLDDVPGSPFYSLAHRGEQLISNARLGLAFRGSDLADEESLQAGFSTRTVDETWHPIYGERSTVRDHFNELTAFFSPWGNPPCRMAMTFRAFDTGIAFHYSLRSETPGREIAIATERTEFRFPNVPTAWCTTSAQGEYRALPISELPQGTERPLTIKFDDHIWLALGEAALVDFPRMKFARHPGDTKCLVATLDSPATVTTSYSTPWRYILVGDSPGQILERNDLLLNLNAPCAIDDTSWIKPGKVIREVTLTTQGGMACVDFAAANNLQYVEFDAGWYGHEYDDASDATTVTVDPQRSPGPLDLRAVIDYARERGIGIILYVNRRALETQLDEILPLYQSWGVAGVKYGFVNVGSQHWTAWLHEAVRKAADNRLMVDIHDEYRPTGYSRTYPNLMTQEGIRGDETKPSNELTLTILFTRMIAGAGDNTICYYNERVDQNASHAYQLAKAVCFYSPWQFLFWYDRPQGSPGAKGGAGGGTGIIGDEPELEFFRAVPTVWDDTRVLHGNIGEYAVIARRAGDAWFVGAMNAGQARTLQVPLRFLDAGKSYLARIYYDDATVATRTHVGIRSQDVDAETLLAVSLGPQGGEAIHITPEK